MSGYTELIISTPYNYNFKIAVWYPIESMEGHIEINYLPYLRGNAIKNAELKLGNYPLVIISSGFGGTRFDQFYIAEHLAQQGFLVAAVGHEQFEKNSTLGCGRAWYRCQEIRLTIDCLLNSEFKKYIKFSDVNLIGFSAGGFVAAMLAGAIPDFEREISFHEYRNLYTRFDYNSLVDNRIHTLCLLAPALGNLFIHQSLQNIKHASLVITAENDEILGSSASNYISSLVNLKKHLVLKKAGHFVFNAPVVPLMKKLAPQNCQDKGLSREQCHPLIINCIERFLHQYGMKSCG